MKYLSSRLDLIVGQMALTTGRRKGGKRRFPKTRWIVFSRFCRWCLLAGARSGSPSLPRPHDPLLLQAFWCCSTDPGRVPSCSGRNRIIFSFISSTFRATRTTHTARLCEIGTNSWKRLEPQRLKCTVSQPALWSKGQTKPSSDRTRRSLNRWENENNI